MSVAEIKTALDALSPGERQEVCAYLQGRPREPSEESIQRITQARDDMEGGKFITRQALERQLAEWEAKGI